MSTHRPTLVIIGQPAWSATLAPQLSEQYTLIHHDDPATYMNALIDNRAAAVLIDDSADSLTGWLTAPKASPATRRIPLVLVSDDSAQRESALLQGADVIVSRADWQKGWQRLLTDIARVPDPEWLAQLDCECQDALPPLAQEGVQKFNAGKYYAQHDLFEEQWVATESPVRDLYRAVLQVGVAYYQIERGNYRGALKMLQRSVQWLVMLPDTCQGIDVAQLRADSFRVRAELERLGEADFDQFDHSLIKGVQYTPVEGE